MTGRAYTGALRAEVRAHAEAAYPAECCGLLLRPAADPGAPAIYRRCDNLQAELPALDPDGRVRGADRAFHLDGAEVVRAEREGLSIVGIVHSHPDHDAYFSAMDRQAATWSFDGDPPEPAYPGVAHLVVSVRQGRTADERWYAWDDATRSFAEAEGP